MLDSMETVDDETIQFDLAYEFGAFEFYLHRSVVPKSVREDDTDAFNKEKPVGSGPYEFDDWSEGEFVTLTKYDDYWRDREPNIDEIEFQPVEEPTTRITELQNGDKDVVKTVPPANWETVQNMDEASIAEVTGVNYFYLAFNCNEGPTADPQVREAIDYLVSMDSAVERFVEPSGIRANAPVPGTISDAWDFPVSEWESIGHDQDIDQGKSMLDGSSSVPDDWEATIIVPPDDKREDIGTSVANGIQEAGYGATVQRLDWGPFIERYNTGNADKYNMFTLGWSGAPDPDTFLYFLFSQETEGVTNGTFYRNQEVEDAIVTGRESLDRAERKRNYESAVMTILEDRVHLPAYSLRNSFGVRSRVEDFRAHPIDQYNTFTEYNNTSVQ
jgi:peptide/nickel transport system substrate-binding protein